MIPIKFPEATNTCINMMPIIMGDIRTIPDVLWPYQSMISLCDLLAGETVYLTVHESIVQAGTTQRRAGLHTDATSDIQWGGGSWGKTGIYMASTDGACAVWSEEIPASAVDEQGRPCPPFWWQEMPTRSVDEELPPYTQLIGFGTRLKANHLYRITDRTPHTSLPSKETCYRQFFRLVGPDVSAWFSAHCTPSPFGVLPKCKIITERKF